MRKKFSLNVISLVIIFRDIYQLSIVCYIYNIWVNNNNQ